MRAAPPSLAKRIGWRLIAVMLASVGLGAAAAGWRALAVVQGLEDTTLKTQAETVVDHLRPRPGGVPVLQLPADLAAAFRASRGTNFYLVTDQAGRPLFASAPTSAQVLAGAMHADGLFRVAASPAEPHGLLGYATTVGPWRVFVAQNREQVENLVRGVLADLLT
ncbi:MAG: sensor histidine kinase N-terminal domain-containing protein, partial [Acetobacteraceae bacterium]